MKIEVAVVRRHLNDFDGLYEGFACGAVLNQVLNGADLESVLAGENKEVRKAGGASGVSMPNCEMWREGMESTRSIGKNQ